jgi:transposase InsO family protein
VQSKHADHVHQRLKDRLKELEQERRRSITFDNGTEFARCDRLEKHLGIKLYYADPGCPYQRGSNENTNGLIRQYFPKGTDFRDISHHEVRRVEKLLNDRPRACLAFRTPAEVFFEKSPPSEWHFIPCCKELRRRRSREAERRPRWAGPRVPVIVVGHECWKRARTANATRTAKLKHVGMVTVG